MGGFSLGLGVGLRYPAPNRKTKGIAPEPDITDGLLLEDGSLFLMEDGSYFQLEEVVVVKSTRSTRKTKTTANTNKNYWNF